jgi:hypothetical protein
MSAEVEKRLRNLAASWPHHRDRGWMEQPIGSGHWRLLWDGGCDQCRRCELNQELDAIVRGAQP